MSAFRINFTPSIGQLMRGKPKTGLNRVGAKTLLMLKYISLITALFISLFTNAQNRSSQSLSDEQIILVGEAVGQIHNDGLDKALEALRRQYGPTYTGDNSANSYRQLRALLTTSLGSYIQTSINPSSDFDGKINGWLVETMNHDFGDGNTLVEQIKTHPNSANFSSELTQGLERLSTLFETDGSVVQRNYRLLAEEVIPTLPTTEEKIYFSSSVGIAYFSSQYWIEKYNTWAAFFNVTPNPLEKSNPWKTIGKKDIAGAIIGGIGGCAYGALGGTVALPGVGTLAGCAALGSAGALAGGLGNSAKQAVENFVDWLLGD